MDIQCDIILLSYENPELLKKCVRSVLNNTRVKSRLIIVDNASRAPEVGEYLYSLKGNDTVSIEKIFSDVNAGFAAGMNKGMKLSTAPYICLLNNDCVVARGWLEEMISIGRGRDDIGLINPQSNTFGSWPDGGASINEHGFLLSDRKGTFVELGHAIGFACLIKRGVVDAIGHLDEAYSGVCYEDTDFSARAAEKGFMSVMAEAAYVFHKEQASRGDLKGREEIYRKNRERFEARWGALLRVLFVVDSVNGRTEPGSVEYEQARGLARERTIIDIRVRPYFRRFEEKLRVFGKPSVRHADIGIKMLPKTCASIILVWRVLTKKKRYNAVITRRGILARFLLLLMPLHKTEVLVREGEMGLRSSGGELLDLGEPAALAKFLRDEAHG